MTTENNTPAAPAPAGVVPAADALNADIQRLSSQATTELPAAAAAVAPAGPTAIEAETLADVRGLVILVGSVAAPNWKLQPTEYEALAQGTTRVLLKYWPNGLGEMGPEMGLALTLVAIAAPRMAQGIPLREAPPDNDDTAANPVNGNQEAAGNG